MLRTIIPVMRHKPLAHGATGVPAASQGWEDQTRSSGNKRELTSSAVEGPR